MIQLDTSWLQHVQKPARYTGGEYVQLPALLKGESEKQSHTRAVDLLKQLGLGERLVP